MLLRGLKTTVVGTGLVVAASAYGQEQSPKIGFEYRFGVTYNDGKINEAKGTDAKSSSSIAGEMVRLTAHGEAAKDVNYHVGYDLGHSSIYSANLVWKYNEMMNFYVGRGKVAQGGWYHKDVAGEHSATATGYSTGYSDSSPLTMFSDSFGVQMNLAGVLSVNVYNDVGSTYNNALVAAANPKATANTDESTDELTDEEKAAQAAAAQKTVKYTHSRNNSKAVTVEWQGNFGGWQPLVQLMSYDQHESLAISAGIKGNVSGLGILANYTTDSRYNYKTDKKDTLTQIDARFSFDVDTLTPWIAYNKFDRKQAGTDAKANAAFGGTDDNAQSIAIGVNSRAFGEGYVPFASVNMISGKYMDAGKDESKSGLVLRAGLYGKF